jgi:hypothetical protein
VGGDSAAEVGADECAFEDLSVAVGDVDVALLEIVDGPAVVVALALLGFAFGVDGLGHVWA